MDRGATARGIRAYVGRHKIRASEPHTFGLLMSLDLRPPMMPNGAPAALPLIHKIGRRPRVGTFVHPEEDEA